MFIMAVTTTETTTLPEPPILGSNQGKVQRQHIRWLRQTPKDTPMPEIRQRLQEDGYVLMKGILPREDVLKVRKDYFEGYLPSKITKPGTDPVDGIFNDTEDALQHGGIGAGELPPTDLQVKLMIDSHRRPEYLGFLEHTDLRNFVRGIMGWEKEVLLQRTMLRHNAPGALSTAVHYDKLFLRGGDAYFLTAWVPIGKLDTP
jgi:phytanoyl-CoA hydroxylase